jgi:hypothetical protein
MLNILILLSFIFWCRSKGMQFWGSWTTSNWFYKFTSFAASVHIERVYRFLHLHKDMHGCHVQKRSKWWSVLLHGGRLHHSTPVIFDYQQTNQLFQFGFSSGHLWYNQCHIDWIVCSVIFSSGLSESSSSHPRKIGSIMLACILLAAAIIVIVFVVVIRRYRKYKLLFSSKIFPQP